MKNFALIGVGGYIAPKHLKAIKDTNNNLIASFDIHDSVGIIDSYFPESSFFTEFERFDRYLDKIKRKGTQIDYVSICSPNYLHDAHVRFALRIGANVICEKPLVINPWNLDSLEEIEKEKNKKINTILQLRLHPSIIKLKKEIDNSSKNKIFNVNLTYITSRGKWYSVSWKGDTKKSGGLLINIGIHFFDLLLWLFGKIETNYVYLNNKNKASGFLKFKKANVKWFLSIDKNDLLLINKNNNFRTYRSIKIDNKEIEFSDGFEDLHTKSYKNILNEKGFGINDIRPSIQIVSDIRNSEIFKIKNNYYHYLLDKISKYAFK